jgi:nicotinamidase-related amidase
VRDILKMSVQENDDRLENDRTTTVTTSYSLLHEINENEVHHGDGSQYIENTTATTTTATTIAPTTRRRRNNGGRSHPLVLYVIPILFVLLCGFLYYLYQQNKRLDSTCHDGSSNNNLCTVLIVVDMQNDYCSECNSTTVSKWATPGLPVVADAINRLQADDRNLIDLTLFTQDWLPSTSPFLRKNTYGSEIMKMLHENSNSLRFTKSSDDWMNNLGPKDCDYCTLAYDNKYHFALNNEKMKNQPNHNPPTLYDFLSSYGYTPEKTRLIVVGTAENRCVMKGSLHAINIGYKDVILYLPGVK